MTNDDAIKALRCARLVFAGFVVIFVLSGIPYALESAADKRAGGYASLWLFAAGVLGFALFMVLYFLKADPALEKQMKSDTRLAWAQKPDWMIASFVLVLFIASLLHIGFKPELFFAMPVVALPLVFLFALPAMKKRTDDNTYAKWGFRIYFALAMFAMFADTLIKEVIQ